MPTFVFDNNERGELVGLWFDAAFAGHTFIRSPDGEITTIDLPGATQTRFVGINDEGQIAINDEGEVVGYVQWVALLVLPTSR